MATYNAILDNIPLNSNIILTGISLGGMIAQQVASQDAIKEHYNIVVGLKTAPLRNHI
jgi:esterase/lipase